jgi:alpha-glucosidase
MYGDADDAAENPDHVIINTQLVTNVDIITIKLAAGGGQAIRLVKQ